jgi:hypothetical protein
MNQQPHTVHPLVAHFLDELDNLLRGIEPVERAEVMEGVREHIETALTGTDRTEADVRVALAEVGPATAVADEAYAGRPLPEPAPKTPATSRTWLPAVVAAFEGLVLLMIVSVAGSTATVSSGSVTATSATGHTTTTTQSSYDGSIAGAVAALFASVPFWLVVIVLVGISSLWTTREKTILMTLPLAAVITVTVLPALGYTLAGVSGVYVGAWTALTLVVVGGAVLVCVLVRRAIRRSAALVT